MNQKQLNNLDHGLYRFWWKSGGSSLVAVGSLPSGKRWFAPTNWVSTTNTAEHMTDTKRVTLIRGH